LKKVEKDTCRHPARRGATKYLRETEKQVQRFERIGQDLGVALSGHTYQAMASLVAEG